jgi:alpha-tubulin suppressor-like RCC1 family protein
MATGFKISQIGNYVVDIDDILLRRNSLRDAQILSWGDNNWFRAGQTSEANGYVSPTPIVVEANGWTQVTASRHRHSAGIKTDGTLWTWGSNVYGQYGNTSEYTSGFSPVTTVAGGTNWKQVSCGYAYSAAIKTDGTLWTWGQNSYQGIGYGQLGDGTTIARLSPVTTAGGGTNWSQVSCGAFYTVGIKTDGTLWTWGRNDSCQLGDGTTIHKSSPVTTVAGGTNWSQVSAQYHTTGIKTDGTLWTWGANYDGRLGDGTTVSKSSPVNVAGGGTNWSQVSVGFYHTAAIKTDGTLWTWGGNSYRQLGDGTTVQKSSPATVSGGGTNWKQISCGALHTTALKTDGTLWAWGRNGYGLLGTGVSSLYTSSPATVISGNLEWKQISCGYDYTLGLSYGG